MPFPGTGMVHAVGASAITLTRHTSAVSSDTNTAVTSAINTVGANFIIVGVSSYPVGAAGDVLTDNQMNTWIGLSASVNTGQDVFTWFYCINPTTNATHTFTDTNAGGYPAIAVLAFSSILTGLDGSQVKDDTISDVNVGGKALTPSGNNELLLSGLSINISNSPYSIDVPSGMVVIEQQNPGTGTNMGIAVAYVVQTTGAGIAPAWSWSGATGAACSSLAVI